VRRFRPLGAGSAWLTGGVQGGPLFLDEIGELPHGVQAKLLPPPESGELQQAGWLLR